MAVLRLSEYLREGAATPFVWGSSDCCLFVCSWVLAQRGVDPMATWRGRYHTRTGAYRRIKKGGGMVATVSAEMKAAGLAETNSPQPGDVGLIPMGTELALAIRTPIGWACKSPRGVAVMRTTPVKAWAV